MKKALLLLLLASCYPDRDKQPNKYSYNEAAYAADLAIEQAATDSTKAK